MKIAFSSLLKRAVRPCPPAAHWVVGSRPNEWSGDQMLASQKMHCQTILSNQKRQCNLFRIFSSINSMFGSKPKLFSWCMVRARFDPQKTSNFLRKKLRVMKFFWGQNSSPIFSKLVRARGDFIWWLCLKLNNDKSYINLKKRNISIK